MSRPDLAQITCDDCQKWVYHFEGPKSGEKMTRRGLPVVRTAPPPCWSCPKKSPDNAWEYELCDQNLLLLDDYWRGVGTSGAYFGGEVDPVTARFFGICARLYRNNDHSVMIQAMAQIAKRPIL